MQISGNDVVVGRVTHEDDDFLTIEFGKHDGVKWTVAPLPGEETQRFYMVLFVRGTDTKHCKALEVWKPWEEGH